MRQVTDIIRGVIHFLMRQWPPGPIRPGMGLGEGNTGKILHQGSVTDLIPQPTECRRNLGIEQRNQCRVQTGVQRFHILPAGVQHHL